MASVFVQLLNMLVFPMFAIALDYECSIAFSIDFEAKLEPKRDQQRLTKYVFPAFVRMAFPLSICLLSRHPYGASVVDLGSICVFVRRVAPTHSWMGEKKTLNIKGWVALAGSAMF